MKEYIKAIFSGIITGACMMQFANMTVESLINKHFAVGGEILLPVLLLLVGYLGWKFAESYFNEYRYKKIYDKGYKEGTKLHNYKIVIPVNSENEKAS